MGPEPGFLVGRMTGGLRRRLRWNLAAIAVLAIVGVWNLAAMLSSSAPSQSVEVSSTVDSWVARIWVAVIAVAVFAAVRNIRQCRARVEVDPFGVTVVNTWRTYRVRWTDIDAVVSASRPTVTLLARDRVINCDAFPMKRSPEPGACEAAGDFLEATRLHYRWVANAS
jgi:hypothetical protein